MYIVFPLTMLSWILFLAGQARIGLAEGKNNRQKNWRGGDCNSFYFNIHIYNMQLGKGRISRKIRTTKNLLIAR